MNTNWKNDTRSRDLIGNIDKVMFTGTSTLTILINFITADINKSNFIIMPADYIKFAINAYIGIIVLFYLYQVLEGSIVGRLKGISLLFLLSWLLFYFTLGAIVEHYTGLDRNYNFNLTNSVKTNLTYSLIIYILLTIISIFIIWIIASPTMQYLITKIKDQGLSSENSDFSDDTQLSLFSLVINSYKEPFFQILFSIVLMILGAILFFNGPKDHPFVIWGDFKLHSNYRSYFVFGAGLFNLPIQVYKHKSKNEIEHSKELIKQVGVTELLKQNVDPSIGLHPLSKPQLNQGQQNFKLARSINFSFPSFLALMVGVLLVVGVLYTIIWGIGGFLGGKGLSGSGFLICFLISIGYTIIFTILYKETVIADGEQLVISLAYNTINIKISNVFPRKHYVLITDNNDIEIIKQDGTTKALISNDQLMLSEDQFLHFQNAALFHNYIFTRNFDGITAG